MYYSTLFKNLQEPALQIASVLCVWRILVRGRGCLTGAADPWGGLSVELGHEEVKELETHVTALFNCQLLLCRNLGYFCFEGLSCWCMRILIVCFGHFKIVLVDCSDWELIRILTEVIGQKKQNKTQNRMTSWGTRETPPNRNIMWATCVSLDFLVATLKKTKINRWN